MAAVLSLPEFLQHMGRTPFVWGETDCCLMASDWMLGKRGVDPAAPLRNRYNTMRGALRHIKRRGGFTAMVCHLMDKAGFRETSDPQPGDVGIVTSEQGVALGIKTPTGWAVKAVTGFVVAPFTHTRAWTI